jgi:hypothetical protein
MHSYHGPLSGQISTKHAMAWTSERSMPLPITVAKKPVFIVNGKQYARILKRKGFFAAYGKLNRRLYFHESRHNHAVTRIRRFTGR